MGNKLAVPNPAASQSDYFLRELPGNIVCKETVVVATGRFLKTLKCFTGDGLVIVKVYLKREASLSLSAYAQQLEHIRLKLRGIPGSHLLPFQQWVETDKAAYLLRPYICSTLRDRIATRPFLGFSQKLWIAYQVLEALCQAHAHGVCHGDLKSENVCLSSWHWVLLADFASFKPALMPRDNPADFSFYFDTSGRKRCSVAPERFASLPEAPRGSTDNLSALAAAACSQLHPAMDIFSAGCVLTELFLDGQPIFDFSSLIAFSRGGFDPSAVIQKVPFPPLRPLLSSMVSLQPDLRPPAPSCLSSFLALLPPATSAAFSSLNAFFFPSFASADSDGRVALTQQRLPPLLQALRHAAPGPLPPSSPPQAPSPNPPILPSVQGGVPEPAASSPDPPALPVASSETAAALREAAADSERCLADTHAVVGKDALPLSSAPLVILTDALCSCLRTCRNPRTRRTCLLLLQTLSRFCDDTTRLQIIIPHVVSVLPEDSPLPQRSDHHPSQFQSANHNLPKDAGITGTAIGTAGLTAAVSSTLSSSRSQAAIVRCTAVEVITAVISDVGAVSPADAGFFPEYLFPALSLLPRSQDDSVRAAYAAALPNLAFSALRFLALTSGIPANQLPGAHGSDTFSNAAASGSEHKASGTTVTPGFHHEEAVSRSYRQHPPPPGLAAAVLACLPHDTLQEVQQLRQIVQHVVEELSAPSPLSRTPSVPIGDENAVLKLNAGSEHVRVALLQGSGCLGAILGRSMCVNVLLPLVISFLNDPSARVRGAFFEALPPVCHTVGTTAVSSFVLPCIEQALTNEGEARVVLSALNCLTALLSNHRPEWEIEGQQVHRKFTVNQRNAADQSNTGDQRHGDRSGTTDGSSAQSIASAPALVSDVSMEKDPSLQERQTIGIQNLAIFQLPDALPHSGLLPRSSLLIAVEAAAPHLLNPVAYVRAAALVFIHKAAEALSPVDNLALLLPLLRPMLVTAKPTWALCRNRAVPLPLKPPLGEKEAFLVWRKSVVGRSKGGGFSMADGQRAKRQGAKVEQRKDSRGLPKGALRQQDMAAAAAKPPQFSGSMPFSPMVPAPVVLPRSAGDAAAATLPAPPTPPLPTPQAAPELSSASRPGNWQPAFQAGQAGVIQSPLSEAGRLGGLVPATRSPAGAGGSAAPAGVRAAGRAAGVSAPRGPGTTGEAAALELRLTGTAGSSPLSASVHIPAARASSPSLLPKQPSATSPLLAAPTVPSASSSIILPRAVTAASQRQQPMPVHQSMLALPLAGGSQGAFIPLYSFVRRRGEGGAAEDGKSTGNFNQSDSTASSSRSHVALPPSATSSSQVHIIINGQSYAVNPDHAQSPLSSQSQASGASPPFHNPHAVPHAIPHAVTNTTPPVRGLPGREGTREDWRRMFGAPNPPAAVLPTPGGLAGFRTGSALIPPQTHEIMAPTSQPVGPSSALPPADETPTSAATSSATSAVTVHATSAGRVSATSAATDAQSGTLERPLAPPVFDDLPFASDSPQASALLSSPPSSSAATTGGRVEGETATSSSSATSAVQRAAETPPSANGESANSAAPHTVVASRAGRGPDSTLSPLQPPAAFPFSNAPLIAPYTMPRPRTPVAGPAPGIAAVSPVEPSLSFLHPSASVMCVGSVAPQLRSSVLVDSRAKGSAAMSSSSSSSSSNGRAVSHIPALGSLVRTGTSSGFSSGLSSGNRSSHDTRHPPDSEPLTRRTAGSSSSSSRGASAAEGRLAGSTGAWGRSQGGDPPGVPRGMGDNSSLAASTGAEEGGGSLLQQQTRRQEGQLRASRVSRERGQSDGREASLLSNPTEAQHELSSSQKHPPLPFLPPPPPPGPIDPSVALLLGFSETGPVEDVSTAADPVSGHRGGIGHGLGSEERPGAVWQPKGVLVAHLQEHRGAVGDVAVALGGTFVLSAADDGRVKLWDLNRISRGTNFISRLTYAPSDIPDRGESWPSNETGGSDEPPDRDSGGQAPSKGRCGRATSVAVLPDNVTAAVGFSSGALHVLSIDHVARAAGPPEQHRGVTRAPFLEPSLASCKGDENGMTPGEGAILQVQSWASAHAPPSGGFSSSPLSSSSSLLLYSSLHGGVTLWDMRTKVRSFSLSAPPSYGYIPRFCLDPVGGNWVVTASSRNVMSLWDVRFLLPVATWRVPIGSPITAMRSLLTPSKCSIGTTSNGQKLADDYGRTSGGSMWDLGSFTGFRGGFSSGFPQPGGNNSRGRATGSRFNREQSFPLVVAAAGAEGVFVWGAHDGRCYEVMHPINDVLQQPGASHSSSLFSHASSHSSRASSHSSPHTVPTHTPSHAASESATSAAGDFSHLTHPLLPLPCSPLSSSHSVAVAFSLSHSPSLYKEEETRSNFPSHASSREKGAGPYREGEARVAVPSEYPEERAAGAMSAEAGPGVQCLLTVGNGAAVVTAGADMRIRYWQRRSPEYSTWVCGPTLPSPSGGALLPRYTVRPGGGARIIEEYLPPLSSAHFSAASRLSAGASAEAPASRRDQAGPGAGAARRESEGGRRTRDKSLLEIAATDLAGCHRDAILALAVAVTQGGHTYLVSGSRDGVVKVWA